MPIHDSTGVTRRTFVRTSAAAAVGISSLIRGGDFAYAGGSDSLRVGLVGCGGRGTGAARDAVQGSEGIVLWAMGDLFEDRLDSSYEQLQENVPAEALQVAPERRFAGFDAYRGVIDAGVDLVILATPPGFRPQHLRAAVEAGKHVFAEKPVAVDSAGIRSVMETARMIDDRGLAFVTGTQRRHDPMYIALMDQVHGGAIGEVVAGQVYWNQGGLWHYERTPGMSDMEWQARNWLYFTWLSGDHIVEQHIHNIDVANWALGGHPVKASGMGGRQVRVDPSYGHVFDHFAVELEYPNGARILSMCRQQDGTARYVGERLVGTRGVATGEGAIRGEQAWRYRGEKVNPYVQEHTNLVASIRAGRPLNEAHRIAETNLTAILAREAAYTGQELTWDEVLNADLDLTPGAYAFGPMPVPPVPEPGITPLSRRRSAATEEESATSAG